MPYAILLNELKPLDLQKTARILTKAENIVYADATRMVRNCSGILAENLSFQEAKSISEELNREGVGVFTMQESEMYRPEPAFTINNADCLEQCFNVQDIYGTDYPLSWRDIILISAGRIVERKSSGGLGGLTHTEPLVATLTRKMMRFPGGIMVPAPPPPPAAPKITEEEHILLDIFSRQPQKRHYRIRHNAFNYDYLGERLRSNSSENFRFLVEDLVGFAGQAYGNRGVNAYLSGEDPEKQDYRDLDHFDKENLWLLQLIHFNASASEKGKPES